MRIAFAKGAAAALDSFGVRLAEDSLQRGMPEGPSHLGAEWLSRLLRAEGDEYGGSQDQKPYAKLQRPVQWSQPVSFEGAENPDFNHPGVGHYEGV